MKYEEIPGNGPIPEIGLGTWEVGGHTMPDYSQDDRIIDAFRAALDMGYRHVDTAEMYGGGHTEELVGQAIQGFPREELLIASKVWHSHLHRQDVIDALEGSLRRLGSDYLDLYLIHWSNRNIPLEETFEALNALVSQGKVKHLGVSNFDLEQLKSAQDLSETPVVTNQVPYSLFNRQYVENGVLAYCQENNILLTAYTPIEKGSVSKNAELQEIAARYGATPVQIALAWLVQQPRVITIPMSTNKKHLRENLDAVEIELTPQDIQRLDQLPASQEQLLR